MMNIILKTEMNWKSRKSAYRGLVLWPVSAFLFVQKHDDHHEIFQPSNFETPY